MHLGFSHLNHDILISSDQESWWCIGIFSDSNYVPSLSPPSLPPSLPLCSLCKRNTHGILHIAIRIFSGSPHVPSKPIHPAAAPVCKEQRESTLFYSSFLVPSLICCGLRKTWDGVLMTQALTLTRWKNRLMICWFAATFSQIWVCGDRWPTFQLIDGNPSG